VSDDRVFATAAREWEIAVALYPTNPRARISAGMIWYRCWQRAGVPDHAMRSLHHFQAALAIDATRPPEVAAKLRSAELRIIDEHLDELSAAGF
jgi:hypothetical protein